MTNIKLNIVRIIPMYAKIVHSAGFVSFELALTSLICCKAKLATNVLIFLCLHIKYIIEVVDSNDIIEETNMKMSKMGLFEKKFL